MKVSGQRLSMAELEDVIDTHPKVTESTVVPRPHELKGEVPVAYVVLKEGDVSAQDLEDELKALVLEKIGAPARPEAIIFVPDLPKTRSGKIMRRVLKPLLVNKHIGDTSTSLNPEVVDLFKNKVGYKG